MTTEELKRLITSANAGMLQELWTDYKKKSGFVLDAPPGKALEFLILKAFDLELTETLNDNDLRHTGYVTYPFDVNFPQILPENCNQIIEQIDGAIVCDGLYSLVEFKDYTDKKIAVDPLSKMRNMLQRRHGNVFGMFFSSSEYTTPAIAQVQYMAPQIIILWTREDMDYCMRNRKFIECMKWKYSQAMEQCEFCADYPTFITHKQREECPPLF